MSLPGEALAGELLALRALIDRLEGQFLRRLEAFDRRAGGLGDGAGSTATWLRTYCRLGGRDAAATVHCARRLADALPATTGALAAGVISRRHVEVIVAAGADLPDDVVTTAETSLVEAATGLDPGQLRRVTGHWRHCVDAELARRDANAGHDRRFLHISATFQGLVAIDGLLDADAGAAVLTAITSLSAPQPGDTRRAAQRRADAPTDLARIALDSGALPDAGGDRPHLQVVLDLPTLRAQPGAPGADLDWAGPVTAETARRLACDATLSRIVTSGGSEILDVGRRTRVIPLAIRRALRVRDGGCVFPGCDRPPPWTDAHHIVHWGDGGPTDLDNLVLLCRRHHRTVHEHRWRITRAPDGGYTASPPPGHPQPPNPMARWA